MANVRDIRKRIRSVKSTQQITKAMKMVAAAKLRRAQESILHARPYAQKMLEVLNSLAARVDRDRHPLLAIRKEKRVHIVVVTADRGLCGGFNTNIIRFASQTLNEKAVDGDSVALDLVGRKGRDFFRKRDVTVGGQWVGIFQKVRYEHADEIARHLTALYDSGEADAVYLIYNEFKSAISQKVVLERLLPIPVLVFEEPTVVQDYLYEPTDQELFETLLPRHVTFQVYRALLESAAAEHGARMSAMEGATKNAKEMIEGLTLYANRVRQAAITKELIEIVSGAQAQG
jgi:F-type H+-transporting ATPase subunit gamma